MTDTFILSPSFLEEFKNQQPTFGPLGEITFRRSYSRPILGEDRTEEFWETLRRVVEGTYSIQKTYCKSLKLPWNDNKGQHSAQEMYRLMWEMKWFPSGRGLWGMGTEALEKKGAAILYNCAGISTEDISTTYSESFCFLADMSMLGVGVGFDTRGAGKIKIKEPRQGNYVFQVEDSREGWVEIIRTIIDAYLGKGALPDKIDYSQVRAYGEPIRTFGGTSSGPLPLKQLVEEDIHIVLKPLIGQSITSTAIVDIFNAIARCVVSGNIRRSASIALGDPSDIDFLHLKDPSINSERMKTWGWASNNSILAELGMDYSKVAELTINNGEPGYFWLENARNYGRMADLKHSQPDNSIILTNPCGEVSLENAAFCLVPETFPARHDTFEQYKRTLKFAYLFAKTVTLLPTHYARSNAVLLRSRQIGLSMSGIIQSIQKHGIRKHLQWCDEGYKYLRHLDQVYSDWLCIPRSKKLTSVKPSGSISLLPGATPGIHFPIAKHYWRTIRMDASSELVDKLKKVGYRIEQAEGHNTVAVYFPVREENFSRARKDVSIWEQLELVAQHQAYWSDNQVSCTVTFKPEEAKDIKRALELYETRLKSVSFLPLTDHKYEHAPYQPITLSQYTEALSKLNPIKWKGFQETEGHVHKYCDGEGSCSVITEDQD